MRQGSCTNTRVKFDYRDGAKAASNQRGSGVSVGVETRIGKYLTAKAEM